MFLIISKLAGMHQWCCLINVLIVEWKIKGQRLEKGSLEDIRAWKKMVWEKLGFLREMKVEVTECVKELDSNSM